MKVQYQLPINGSQIYTFSHNVYPLKELSTSRYLFIIIRMSVRRFSQNSSVKTSLQEACHNKDASKKFRKIHRKHICRCLFFSKVVGCRLTSD